MLYEKFIKTAWMKRSCDNWLLKLMCVCVCLKPILTVNWSHNVVQSILACKMHGDKLCDRLSVNCGQFERHFVTGSLSVAMVRDTHTMCNAVRFHDSWKCVDSSIRRWYVPHIPARHRRQCAVNRQTLWLQFIGTRHTLGPFPYSIFNAYTHTRVGTHSSLHPTVAVWQWWWCATDTIAKWVMMMAINSPLTRATFNNFVHRVYLPTATNSNSAWSTATASTFHPFHCSAFGVLVRCTAIFASHIFLPLKTVQRAAHAIQFRVINEMFLWRYCSAFKYLKEFLFFNSTNETKPSTTKQSTETQKINCITL